MRLLSKANFSLSNGVEGKHYHTVYNTASSHRPHRLAFFLHAMDDSLPVASTPVKKRTRKPNWTMDESLYLLQLYRDHARILRNNFSEQGCSHQSKQKAWEEITGKLGQAFPAGQRTAKECQKRWHTILVAARPKLSQVRQDFAATGKRK